MSGLSFKTMYLDIVVGAKKINISSEKNYVWNLSSDVILVKEHGCIYGWTNGTKSDNAISIQTMATQKMVGRNIVTPNMTSR